MEKNDNIQKNDKLTDEKLEEMGKIEFDLNGDISDFLKPDRVRQQSLAGFDDDYTDIVDYIVRCTYKIWDEHNIGLIYSHYQHRSRAHMPDGLVYGREKVVQATAAAQNAFPDFQLVVDDVVWRGNDVDGFDTSMPSTALGTNTGWSFFGAPTGKKICRRGIANCFSVENRIVEEWVVHDDVTVVNQLGLDLDEVIDDLIARGYCDDGDKEPAASERVHGEETPAPLPPAPKDEHDVEGLIRRAYAEVFNWRMIGKVDAYYDEQYRHLGCRNLDYFGHAEYKKFLLSWLSMFPDAEIIIEDIYWNGDAKRGYRASTRWKLVGTHLGNGIYGAPTGARIEVMGITNHLIRGGQFIEALDVYTDLEIAVRVERARRKKAAKLAD